MTEYRLYVDSEIERGSNPDYDSLRCVITASGQPITDEESEACAVLVRCMREGMRFKRYRDGYTEIEMFDPDYAEFTGDTPTQAYNAAIAARETT